MFPQQVGFGNSEPFVDYYDDIEVGVCPTFVKRSHIHRQTYESSKEIRRLRTTNFAATDEEISHIYKNIFPEIRKDIDEMNNKIEVVEVIIHRMGVERDRLLGVQTRYKRLLSPRRELPMEVWNVIFAFAGTDDEGERQDAYHGHSTHWTLSHVCQLWRNVVHSTRSLWSKFRIIFPSNSCSHWDVEHLKWVLERGGRRLDVTIEDRPRVRGEADSLTEVIREKMVSMLFDQSHRWRSAHFVTVRGSDYLFPRLQSRLSALEELSIDFESPEGTDEVQNGSSAEDLPILRGFSECPNLWRVTLNKRCRRLDIPWGQLKVFVVAGVDANEDLVAYTQLIHECTSLQTLEAHSPGVEGFWEEASLPLVVNSTVHTLNVGLEYTLEHLTLPALRNVTLDNAGYTIPPFYGLLVRSSCGMNITSLKLRSFVSNPMSLSIGPVLYQVTNLRELELDAIVSAFDVETGKIVSDADGISDITNLLRALGALDEVTGKPCFLPLLESITIRVEGHIDGYSFPYFGEEDSLGRALRCRWDSESRLPARLKKFGFYVTASFLAPSIGRNNMPALLTGGECSSLWALWKDGMDLELRVSYDQTQSSSLPARLQVPTKVHSAGYVSKVTKAYNKFCLFGGLYEEDEDAFRKAVLPEW